MSKETITGYEVEITTPSVPHSGSCVLCDDGWRYLDTSAMCPSKQELEDVVYARNQINLSMFAEESVVWSAKYRFEIKRSVLVVK